jgi:Aspartyl protease
MEVPMRVRVLLVTILVTCSIGLAAADRPGAPVRLAMDDKGGIVVEVRVNGAGPFKFMLDTGAARSLVAEDLAREVSAPIVAKSEVVTSAGSDVRLVARLQSLEMASATANDLLAPVLPAARLAQLGRGVRGLLGQDFLSAFNYTLDYRRGRLTWDGPLACDGPDVARMTSGEGRFVMSLEDDRGAPLRLVPDSGAQVPVLFHAPDASGSKAPMTRVTTMRKLRVGSAIVPPGDAYVVERADADADGLLPLHGFSSVSFAAGGACLMARR